MKRKRYGDNAGWIYLLRTGWHYKIGKTKNVKARVADLQTASPYLIEIICAIYVGDMNWEEAWYHKRYTVYRTNGEWFELPPDVVEEVKGEMLNPVDTLYGDIGDDRNWLIYMEGDYTVKRKLRESFGDDPWFPDEETAEGYYVWLMCRPCPHLDDLYHNDLPDGITCSWCGNTGEVFAEDIGVLCGDTRPTPANTRRLTDEEYQALTKYQEWQDAEEEEDVCIDTPGIPRPRIDYIPKVGDSVFHRMFGDGVVLGIEQNSDFNDWEATIKWPDRTRRISVSMAGLQPSHTPAS